MAFKMAGWSPFTRKTEEEVTDSTTVTPDPIYPIGRVNDDKLTEEEKEEIIIRPKDNKERLEKYEEHIKNEAKKMGLTVEEYKALKQRELEEYMGR